MAKVSTAKQNFTAGELSPRLYGRTDLGRYDNGATTVENFLIQPHGGLTRRPGTKYVAEVKSSSAKTRLIRFQFNVEQSYIIEIGNNYMRFYKDGGQIVDSGSAVEISTSYTTAEIPDLKFAQTADVMYIVHPSHPPRKLTRSSHTSWTIADVVLKRGAMLDENATTTTLIANGRTGNVNITASTSLFTSDDVGRLVQLHEGFAKISSITSATVAVAAVQELEDGRTELMPTYAASTISFHEGDPDSTGLEHNDRIQDTAGGFIDEGFKVGMKVSLTGSTSNNFTDFLIVTVTDTTMLFAPGHDLTAEAAGDSCTLVGSLIASTKWRLGAFYVGSYPSTVAFYEQRLALAGTSNQPQTIFFSQSGDFENFEIGTNADDGLQYTIGSNEVNVIKYLVSGSQLVVGTSGGEFVVRASGFDEPLTPTNTQIKQQTTFGSSSVQPLLVGNSTLFIQRAKRKLRELTFSNESNSYVAPDMTILAEHITDSGLEEMAYQQEPDSVAWTVRADGTLACMTFRREEQVVAWHRHILGGRFGECTVTVSDYANIAAGTTLTFTKSDGTTVTFTSETAGSSSPSSSLGFRPNTDNDTTADNIYTAINAHADFTVANPSAAVVTITETNHKSSGFLKCVSSDTTRLTTTDEGQAVVESVATIPGDLDEDQVWLIVKRTINGSTKRYIEYLSNFDFGSDVNDAFFVDSGLSYSGSAATSISGLSHLEGQSVSILADGAAHADKTVSSGAVTLDRSVTKAHIGLQYSSKVETLRIDAGAVQGTSQGKNKRINEVTVRLFRTVGLKVGTSSTNLDTVPFRSSADGMDSALSLFSGDKKIEFNGGYDEDATISIVQELPLPMTILAIFPTLDVFEK
tara:strand:- start:933 stop:3515 length:2583 start_codon:yes stop_codon:yes gene_type:complete